MRFIRRSRVRSSRGHVRVDEGPVSDQWIIGGIGLLAILVVVLIVLTQVVLPLFDEEDIEVSNRTWLEFAWTTVEPNEASVQQLTERLQDHDIDRVYLEVAAWRADGTLLEGEFARAFATLLREAHPDISILVWVRMSGAEIGEEARRDAVVDLVRKATGEWGFDGVQLNGRAILNDSEVFITLLRALRGAVGEGRLLSVTVPPDRIPADPDVPAGTPGDPGLTWSLNYKQRVGLLDVDEIVVMAHASGLTSSEDYATWVAYQVENYATNMGELDDPPTIVIALPTYDDAPEHDPAVEDVATAIEGVKRGIERADKHGDLVTGVGLYEYKTTDSREWTFFAQQWLTED